MHEFLIISISFCDLSNLLLRQNSYFISLFILLLQRFAFRDLQADVSWRRWIQLRIGSIKVPQSPFSDGEGSVHVTSGLAKNAIETKE